MMHRLMLEYVAKHGKMHKSEESQIGATKQAYQHQEKDVYRAHQHHGGVSHKWSHPINP